MKILIINRTLTETESFYSEIKDNRREFDILLFPYLNKEKLYFLEWSRGNSNTNKILNLFSEIDLIGKFDEECEYEGFSIDLKKPWEESIDLLTQKLKGEIPELTILNLTELEKTTHA